MKTLHIIQLLSFIILLRLCKAIGDPQITDDFALLKNITKLIIQPREFRRIQLDEYFRGQLITCEWLIQNNSQNTSFIDPNVVNISAPVPRTQYVKTGQSDNLISLPQTTVSMTDDYNNKYLIFVDGNMYLNIYNITNYYLDQQSQAVQRVEYLDLHYISSNIDDSKECNNLLFVDVNLLMINCKSIFKQNNNHKSITLYINLTNLTSISVQQNQSGFIFEEMIDGWIVPYIKMNDTYLAWMKTNTTDCHISLVAFNRTTPLQFIATLEDFVDDPVLRHTWSTQKEPTKDCSEFSYVDLNAKYLESLQIQLMMIVDYYPNVVIASDYNYGILIWEIVCSSAYDCKHRSLSRVPYRYAGPLVLLPSDSYKKEKVIIVQILNPPEIIEINIDLLESPYLAKIYRVAEDVNSYYALKVVDVNSDYILTNLIYMKTFKPLLRIYKRGSTFFSSAIAEITISEYIDSALYIHFIKTNINSFVVRTSNAFSIYRIQPAELIVNAWDQEYLENQNYMGNSFTFILTAKNYSMNQISDTFEIEFVKQDNNRTFRVYEEHDINKTYTYSYTCGTQHTQLSLDSYFSWFQNDLYLEQLNNDTEDEFFYISKPRVLTYNGEYNFTAQKCYLNNVFDLSESTSGEQNGYALICSIYDGNQILLISLFQENESKILTNFSFPQSNILEQQLDEEENTIYILSNKSADSDDAAIFHILKIYNIMTWDYSIYLNKEFSELQDFRFRYNDAMTYLSSLQQGCLISNPTVSTNMKSVKQQFVVFELKSSIGGTKFDLRGTETLKFPYSSTNQTLITHIKMSNNGFVWILLNNNTMLIYEQVDIQATDVTISRTMLKLFRNINMTEFVLGNIHYFFIYKNMMIAFQDTCTITIFKFDYTSLKLYRLMILPLHIQQEEDLVVEYKFVIHDITQKVSFATHQNIFFVLFEIYKNNTFFGYNLLVYDIEQPRHNSLIYVYNLPLNISDDIQDIDMDYVHIEVFKKVDDEFFVTILLRDQIITSFNMVYETTLKMNSLYYNELNHKCQLQDYFIRYKIYPLSQKDQVLYIQINATNKGMIIYTEQKEDNLTVEIPKQKVVNKYDIHYNKFLLSNFHGYNMYFNYSCTPEQYVYDNNDHICDDLIIYQGGREYSRAIEFVSNSNPVIGFFFIEPILLFFIQKEAKVFFYQSQQYQSIPVNDIFIDQYPIQYFLFDVHFNNTIQAQALIFLNEKKQFGLSKVYTKFNSDGIQNYSNYVNFSNTIFIQKAYQFQTIPTNISLAELYPEKQDLWTAIFVFDTEELGDLSLIHFYTMNISQEDSVYFEKRNELILNAAYLNFDTFKVSAIQCVDNSNILVIGIDSYGIMIYDLNDNKIIKLERLVHKQNIYEFIIQSIVPDQKQGFRVIVSKYGVISMYYSDPYYQDEPVIKVGYLEQSIAISNNKQTARGDYGFAFIEGETDTSGTYYYLRFFSYYSGNNTKSIGTYNISKNEQCYYLQSIKWDYAANFISNVTKDDFTLALICGTMIKIVAFNYHPHLYLGLQNNYQQEETQAFVNISVSNMISSDFMQLNLTILSSKRAIGVGFYFAIGVLLCFGIFLLSTFRKFTKSTLNEHKKIDKNQKPKSILKNSNDKKEGEYRESFIDDKDRNSMYVPSKESFVRDFMTQVKKNSKHITWETKSLNSSSLIEQ